MTLEDLHAFVAAYEAQSMSEAARRLGCTQAAIAHHVRRLEQELRAELFKRLRRGVAPTVHGNTLYEAAQGALASLQVAANEIGRSVQARHHRLRIATSTVIVDRYLRAPLQRLRQLHPNVAIEIVSENTAECRLNALREGRADLAAIPLVDPVQSLEVRPCHKTKLVLLVHHEHEFANRKQLELADLGTIRYIAQASDSATYRHIERALCEAGVRLVSSQIVADAAAAMLLVEAGCGTTFVPARVARLLERSHAVRGIAIPALPPLQIAWVARKFALLPNVAAEFLGLCAQEPTARAEPARASAALRHRPAD